VIAIPTVDLRDGTCVQPKGGSSGHPQPNHPLEVARAWSRHGFRRLHLADLDAATGRGSNAALVREILRDMAAEVQVAGGIHETSQIEDFLSDGAARVVVGTRALQEPDWLAEVAEEFPGQVILAADVRQRRVMSHSAGRRLGTDVFDVLEDLAGLPLSELLLTLLQRDGQVREVDLPLIEDLVEAADVPIFAFGGVTSLQDLRALEHHDVAGVVIGMALYTGALDPRLVATEYSE
jgi:phosphoribosylformimino-5-aminoimidazole carboxamide ribotide isomerase